MPWTIHLQPVRNPRADDALLAAGRALYIAQAFEDKCRSLLRFAYLVEAIQADPVADLADLIEAVPSDRLLKQTLDELAKLHPDVYRHVDVLSDARGARNYIAHEAVLFGIHSERVSRMADRLIELRRQVRVLAVGDNLVSAWSFRLHEPREPMPMAFIASYESRIDHWVFEPVLDLLE